MNSRMSNSTPHLQLDKQEQQLNEIAQIVLNLSETQCELINTFKNEVSVNVCVCVFVVMVMVCETTAMTTIMQDIVCASAYVFCIFTIISSRFFAKHT